MSDGVSDNFYPEFHGKKPSDFGKEGEWQDKGLTYLRHSEFMRTFEEAIAKKTSVKDIAEAIQAYIASKTHERKLYLFDHPEEQAPEDHLNYPGKPDHASCIIIQISKEKTSRMKYRSADK
jgi:hypothetical protein